MKVRCRLDAFLYGLDDYIKLDVRIMKPTKFNKALAITLKHEMKHKKGKPKKISKSSSTQSSKQPQQQNGKSTSKNPSKAPNGAKSQTIAQANTSQPKRKEKAKELLPMTLNEKLAKGIIGGYLTSEKVLSYKEGRCFKCQQPHLRTHETRLSQA